MNLFSNLYNDEQEIKEWLSTDEEAVLAFEKAFPTSRENVNLEQLRDWLLQDEESAKRYREFHYEKQWSLKENQQLMKKTPWQNGSFSVFHFQIADRILTLLIIHRNKDQRKRTYGLRITPLSHMSSFFSNSYKTPWLFKGDTLQNPQDYLNYRKEMLNIFKINGCFRY